MSPPPLPPIVRDPKVMLGKPVVAGTRITVELILEKLAAGEPRAQIERAYPHLPPNSIEAALAYAVGLVQRESAESVAAALAAADEAAVRRAAPQRKSA